MKPLSPLVLSIISQGFYNAFLFVTIDLREIVFKYTTLPYNVTVGEDLYLSDHSLLTVEPPKMGDSLAKDSYTIKFSDSSFIFKPYVNNTAGSSLLKIEAGLINTEDHPILSSSGHLINSSAPILDLVDISPVFQGTIDSMQYIMSETNGIILEIKAASPLGILDASNTFYCTPHALQERSPSLYDSAFDQVTTSSSIQEILWGKKL